MESSIRAVRGVRVLLDRDLAGFYGVHTRVLIQAVQRNRARFPSDFMFQLTVEESRILRSQTVISSSWGGRRTRPYVFSEQGVAMLSSVLRSDRAVRVNIEIMRAFVRLRGLSALQEDLSRKVAALEGKYDGQFKVVFDALRELTRESDAPKERIGFGESRGASVRHPRVLRSPPRHPS